MKASGIEMPKTPRKPKQVETLTHGGASRRNIPTAEFEPVLDPADREPARVAWKRRNRDLDPQLVWRGKDLEDWSDLVTPAPPLFIQEKVHPKALIDGLRRESRARRAGAETGDRQPDLFADFNGLPAGDARTEFYRHDANWSNRMILGDSLQVMASLAEREGLRGKVQCIYLDPPYGIRFNSNFQWSTTSRDVKDGKAEHVSREPEQVKAFRDTWRDGIHSYLTYLRDRLTVARELLTESGSIFVQIGDENVHRVRALMDEVFGEENFAGQIIFSKTTGQSGGAIPSISDYLLWYAKSIEHIKRRPMTVPKPPIDNPKERYVCVEPYLGKIIDLSVKQKVGEQQIPDGRILRLSDLTSQTGSDVSRDPYIFHGRAHRPSGTRGWSVSNDGLARIDRAGYLYSVGTSLLWKRYRDETRRSAVNSTWFDLKPSGFGYEKNYIVETNPEVLDRCVLMTTDPGDLVLDPTCGSGTTAYVAEQWGRRWITIDTSRVALALARARVMGARYPYYLLADSPEGQRKEAEVTGRAPSEEPTRGDVRQGFVYGRVPHVTLKSIANNAEIDVIWERWQETLEPLRRELNAALGRSWEEWEVPRDAGDPWPAPAAAAWKRFEAAGTDEARTAALQAVNAALDRGYTLADPPAEPRDPWPAAAAGAHGRWWEARIARQREIDASIAARADVEYLYDKPYEDGRKVRVAGPFTVESLSPHRLLALDERDELIDRVAERAPAYGSAEEFAATILGHLAVAGVQQARKADRIRFTALEPWPGVLICAEGRYVEGDAEDGAAGAERRAGIVVGPEFGTLARQDLVRAAREAGDAGFDVLIACAFNYEPHATEFDRLGALPVLKARMNADLHMAGDLANTGKGNLFVVFGEPDIEILRPDGDGEAGGDGAAGEEPAAGREAGGDGAAGEEAAAGEEPAAGREAGGDGAAGEEAAADGRIQVKINGVDVFHPSTGEVRSDGADGIACWFIDTDYDDESFFVRHAYFLGAADPYKALRTTLKAEIDPDAWATLHSDTSRPFERPASGRIAVKVINHLGDEVMKVFRV